MNYRRFSRYAWFVVGFTILVILWGAVVRATGSGAGCGNHWPDCNGEVIPRAESIETLIEFSHRLTSGLCGVFVLGMLIWAFRLKPVRPFVRWMAAFSFIFILIEGGLGMALVRLELVEDNASVLRGVMIGLHLMNTLVLLLFMVLTAWGAGRERVHLTNKQWIPLLGAGLVGYLVLSAAGAVTALGDTLFLSGALERQGLNPAEHFLVELRVIHPMLAIVVSAYLITIGLMFQRRAITERAQNRISLMILLVVLQIGLGVANIFFKAPIVMQLSHLLLADALWIVLLMMCGELLSPIKSENPVQSFEGAAPAVAIGDEGSGLFWGRETSRPYSLSKNLTYSCARRFNS